MKYEIYLSLILLLCSAGAFSQIITVNQDGSGDYETIQQAIGASVDGDTVLVWPGTYVENIDFSGKNITVGSLNLTTGENNYIHETIIDGNQNGSCVKIENGETNALLQGFTLLKGSGEILYLDVRCGGGVSIRDADLELKNSVISFNFVNGGGGGIFLSHANLKIAGCRISNNQSFIPGGGICVTENSNVSFDTVNLCQIYNNFANRGNDFHKTSACITQHIVVDTFTVLNPDSHFISSISNVGYQTGDYTFKANHGKIEPANQDIYVSPSGSDANSGLTPQEPLKTIAFALNKIYPDSSGERNTIHLAPGTYAPSITGEKFPLNMRGYVIIEGEHRDSVILDAEKQSNILKGSNLTYKYDLKKMSLLNGKDKDHGIINAYKNNDSILFEDLYFSGGTGKSASALRAHSCNNLRIINCEFDSNYQTKQLRISSSNFGEPNTYTADTVYLQNCDFHHSYQLDPDPYQGVSGGAIMIGSMTTPDSLTCYITNTKFTDNTNLSHPPYKSTIGLGVGMGAKAFLINSTVANNIVTTSPLAAGVGVTYHSKLFIYNSIIHGNDPWQVYVASGQPSENCRLEIYNSLLQGGEESIHVFDPSWHEVYYDSSNIAKDPLFDERQPYPYSLSYGSPCINTGTLDLPPGVELPETDLAGNPRVWDGQIDMGAYEYGPWVGVDYRPPAPPAPQITAAPNPFIYQTTITYKVKEKGKQQIRVYDLRGNHVATLLDVSGQPGRGVIRWNASDSFGNELPAGVYVVELIVNGESKGSVKVVKR